MVEIISLSNPKRESEAFGLTKQILHQGKANRRGLMQGFCEALPRHHSGPSQTRGFGAWSKDDLEAKESARKMILIVGTINKEYFPDKP
jgi:hypothetical protein